MTISRAEAEQLRRLYAQAVERSAGPEAPSSVRGRRPGDRVEVSTLARKAALALAAVPEIREDHVRAIARAIAEGTYEVPADAVAERMLAETAGRHVG